jgi:hypothetical protein
MPQTSTTSPPTPAAESPVARGLRLGLLWGVAALACFVAYRLGGVWAEWRQLANQRPEQQALTADENAMDAAMFPLAGQWTFGDLDWGVRSEVASHDEVLARLQKLANFTSETTSDEFSHLDPKLLQLTQELHIQPVAHGANLVYAWDQPEVKGQLVTREVAGQAKIVSLAAAVRQDDEHWQFLDLSARQAADHPETQNRHLLPLPAEARRAAGRFDDAGNLQLEIVELNANGDDLIRSWRKAGWQIHATGLGDSDAFNYLCARGNDTIYVRSADDRTALKNLMLSNTPGTAAQTAKQ